jgi:hypothetical protein
MTIQICVGCGQEKTLENDFYRNSIKANGYDAKCKLCRSSMARRYRVEHSSQISEQRREKYALNRETILEQKKQYYRDNAEHLLTKKTEYWHTNKSKISERVAKWREQNKHALVSKSKQYRKSIIEAALLALGGVCQICGESEKEFLTIDHINDDGNKERHMGSLGWKRKILDGTFDKSRYQVLCHNCNVGRYRLYPVNNFVQKPLTGETRFCPDCCQHLDKSMFLPRGHVLRCLSCENRHRTQQRMAAIHALGGTCRCCGINEWHKLVVDHMQNNGSTLRADGQRTGMSLMTAILRGDLDKSDYQLLCWNCNHSKHRGHGLCIHQRSRQSALNGTPARTTRNKITNLNVPQTQFKLSSVLTSAASLKECQEFLTQHHYAGFGRSSSLVYGAWVEENLIGVAKFAPPVRQGIAKAVGLENGQVLELDRFCIHPMYHAKNFASFFMSKAIKWIAANKPQIVKLVSFADPRFGHVGTIYVASNWQRVGETARSYYYEDTKGYEVNKKTLYEFAKARNMQERQCAEALGYKKVHTPPKIKFVYDLR